MSAAPAKNEKILTSPGSNNDVQKIAEIKEYLEGRITELELEMTKLKDMLQFVDSSLREQSFVPAIALQKVSSPNSKDRTSGSVRTISPAQKISNPREVGREPAQVQPVPDQNSKELRRTKDSMLVGNAFVSDDRVVVVPTKNLKLSSKTPPFEPFFINRILRGFQSKDEQDAKSGKLKPTDVLRYDVQEFEGNIANVTVVNYRDSSRLNEILNTVTWAFTKMLEKK